MSKWNWGLGIEHETVIWHGALSYFVKGSKLKTYYQDKPFLKHITTTDKDSYPVIAMFNASKALKELTGDSVINELRNDDSVTLDYNDISVKCKPEYWPGNHCMLEFVTRKFKNVTIDDAVRELSSIERAVLKQIKTTRYAKNAEKYFGELMYATLGMNRFTVYEKEGVMDMVSKNYFGSYHFNITLPYSQDITDKQFDYEHLQVARMIQWLSPIVLSVFGGGDSASFMDRDHFAEGSYRAATNEHSRPGASTLKSVIPKKRYLTQRSDWILDANRELKGYPKLSKECGQKYNRCGTDYRRAEEHVNKGRFGFELRIFDNIPRRFIKNLLMLIMYIADHTYAKFISKGKSVPQATQNSNWSVNMKLAVKYGWNVSFDDSYIALVKNVLKIDLKDYLVDLKQKNLKNYLPTINTGSDIYSVLGHYLRDAYKTEGYYTNIIYAAKKSKKPSPLVVKKEYPNMWTHRIHMDLYFVNPTKKKKLKRFVKNLRKKQPFTIDTLQQEIYHEFGEKGLAEWADIYDYLREWLGIITKASGKTKGLYNIKLLPKYLPLEPKVKKYIPVMFEPKDIVKTTPIFRAVNNIMKLLN